MEITGQEPQQQLRRTVLAGTLGSLIEWFDFTLYGAASALVIGPLFFPNFSATAGILAGFATFGVGFLARPVGGVVFAHIGDRHGRKPALIATIVLMGGSTVVIGLLPTFDSIGIWAPALLVALRVCQGLGAGAELSGALTMIVEHARRRRVFFNSFASLGVAAGQVLASLLLLGLVALLPRSAFLAWGWRVPFVASVVILLVAFYIRRRIAETPEFTEVVDNPSRATGSSFPLVQVLRRRPHEALLGFLAMTGLFAHTYVLNTFALSYISDNLAMGKTVGLTAVLTASSVAGVLLPVFGMVGDRIGSARLLAGGAALSALVVVPFFLVIQTRVPVVIVVGLTLAYAVAWSAMQAAHGTFLADLFDVRFRYTGIAIPRELSGALVGGPAPFIAAALVAAAGGSPWLLLGYLVISVLVTIVATSLVQWRRQSGTIPVPAGVERHGAH